MGDAAVGDAHGAREIKILVASPPGEADQQKFAQAIIEGWNAKSSGDNAVHITPKAWVVDPPPEPEEMLLGSFGRELVDKCAMLVFIFRPWIGNSTRSDKEKSGQAARKLKAIIYPSEKPNDQEKIQMFFYGSLLGLISKCQRKNLVYEYSSCTAFENSFRNHLEVAIGGILQKATHPAWQNPAYPTLTDDEKSLLVGASKDPSHRIEIQHDTNAGSVAMSTNGQVVHKSSGAPDAEQWNQIIKFLFHEGFICHSPTGDNMLRSGNTLREYFDLTDYGARFAGSLGSV